MRSKVFISYSHEDSEWLRRVQQQLGVLVSAGLIDAFDDTQIGVGEYWQERLDRAMLDAQVALLLISAGFLTSEFIRSSEVPQLFAQHAANGMNIYPLLIKGCAWEQVPWLAKLQIKKPEGNRAVASLPSNEIDDYLANVARDIATIVKLSSAATNEQSIGVSEAVLQPSTVISIQGPLSRVQLSDEKVKDVVSRLQHLHQQGRTQTLAASDLLPELDLLFDRKTFRRESLRGCVEQRWDDRLDAAYQTLRVLEAYRRNVREAAPDKWSIYEEIVAEVDRFCMQQGELLFEPAVDYNAIKKQIGKPAFKANLPKKKKFDVDARKLPIISNEINDAIEPHRLRALQLMDQLLGRAFQANDQQR